MSLTDKDTALANYAAGLGRELLFSKQVGFNTAINQAFSYFTAAGFPGAASYSGTALDRIQVKGGNNATHAVLGAPPATSPRARYAKGLELLGRSSNALGTFWWWDMVAYYPGIDATSAVAQTMDNATALPRFADAEADPTGLQMLIEVTTAFGTTAGSETLAINYTDQDGNAGATSIDLIQSAIAGRIPHLFLPIPLASGDTGVRSIVDVTMGSALTTGAFAIVLGKPLARIANESTNKMSPRDLLDESRAFELHEDAALVPFLISAGTATTPLFDGSVDTVEA